MSSRWTDPAWLTEVRAWLAEHVEVTGDLEQVHVQAWATAIRVPTANGSVWFKATTDANAHEAAVLRILARHRPDRLPELLAADEERRWMLTADAGTQLRHAGTPERWPEILRGYAELQVDAAADADALVAAGAPDRRLALIPAAYDALLADAAALRVDEDDGLLDAEVDALRALRPDVAPLCDELAAPALPETIQHDDLHAGNVLVELDPLRDAYLEPWRGLGAGGDLARGVARARRLGW